MNISFIGDLTVDKYPDQKQIHLGGSSLNSAIWAKRLGAIPSVLAAVGYDAEGKAFLQTLENQGVNSALVKTLPGKTSSIDIFLDESGEKRFGGWDPGVLASYHLGDQERVFLKGQDAALLIVYGPTAHLVHEFVAIGKEKGEHQLFAVDFGDFTQFHNDMSLVKEAGGVCDVLFFGLHSQNDGALIATLKEYAQAMQATIVVTLAHEGSLAFVGDKTTKQKTKSVTPVDTTGAGDAYMAGFLSAYGKFGLEKAMKVGTDTALQAITQLGAY